MKLTAALSAFFASQTSAFTLQTPRTSLPAARLDTSISNYKVFIDGEAGTTGLQVRGRIGARDDLEIISAPEGLRRDEATRRKLINEADAVILCKLIRVAVRRIPFLYVTIMTYISDMRLFESVSISASDDHRSP